MKMKVVDCCDRGFEMLEVYYVSIQNMQKGYKSLLC